MLTKSQIQTKLNEGGTVTLSPGVYRMDGLKVPKGATLVGGDGVIFDGSREIHSNQWTTSGSLRGATYASLPAENGAGIDFLGGMNLNDRLGVHPDQAWVGDHPLRRVKDKASVKVGMFAVVSGKLWVHSTDAAKGVSVSRYRVWGDILGTLKNVTIQNYSPNAKDSGGVRLSGGTMQDVTINHLSFNSVLVQESGSVLRRVTLKHCGWMGININLARGVTMDHVTIRHVNWRDVFKSSPQSGAMKASRSSKIVVTNARITDVRGHGLWFDQSCTDAVVHDSYVRCTGAAVFFEISHGLDLRRSDLEGSQAVKYAGSSGGYIVGNTLKGEKDVVGIYMDPRSHQGWSHPSSPKHPGVYSSDKLPLKWWDPRVTWLTRIEELRGNDIAMPTKTGYCGKPVKVCVLTKNQTATRTYAQMVPNGHQEDGKTPPPGG